MICYVAWVLGSDQQLRVLPWSTESTESTKMDIIETDHIDLHVLSIARRNMQDANPNVP